jgi:hypothetical protein
MDNRTELAVHRLLLRSLRDLEAVPDDDWDAYVQQMTGTLLELDRDVGRTLVAVVRAEVVIRQLLMELLLPHPNDSDVEAIVAGATTLLDGLDDPPELAVGTGVGAAPVPAGRGRR